MNDILEKGFAEASKLPTAEWEAFGAWILAELADEREWQRAFDASRTSLDQLADEALAEHRSGPTRPLKAEGE